MVEEAETVGLSEAGLAQLVRALVESRGRRIASATVDGKRVWIKRFDAGNRGFAKWLHAAGSALALHPFLRSSPWLTPQAQVQRERRKSAAFRAAGFPTPTIHHARDAVMVSAHCEPLASHELARLSHDPAAHDALLAQCADALGRAHASGLCHGRPHPRDMFLEDGEIGFLDFEEEPEAAMPLATAQARDAWLLIQQIAGATLTPGSDRAAFDAWRRNAPTAAVTELRKAVDLFAPVTALLAIVSRTGLLGGDGRRIRDAGLLLRQVFTTTQAGANPAPIGKSAP